MNKDIENCFLNFSKTIENNAVIIALDFDTDSKITNKLYTIDKDYKIIKDDITNILSGYSFNNNLIIHNNKLYAKDDIIKKEVTLYV